MGASSSSDARFRLHCREPGCANDWRLLNCYCRNCGAVSALIESSSGESDAQGEAICEKCSGTVASSGNPEHCDVCLSTESGWRDPESGEWFQPDLTTKLQNKKNGFWVSGRFDGAFEGNPLSASNGSALGSRSFNMMLFSGTLKDVTRVEGPQASLADLEKHPVRQAAVQDITLRFGDRKSTTATLYDLRLHDWGLLGAHEEAATSTTTSSRALGRIQGRAFGYIRLNETTPETPPPITQDPLSAEIPAVQDEQVSANTVAPSTGPGYEGSSVAQPQTDCISGNWLLLTGLSVLFWLLCNFWTALFGVLGAGLLVALLDKSISQKPRMTPLREAGLIAALFAISSLGVWLVTKRPSIADCSNQFAWALLLPLGAFIASAWFRHCWLKVLLLAFWLFALQANCGYLNNTCGKTQQTVESAKPGDAAKADATPSQTPAAEASATETPQPPGFFQRLKDGIASIKEQLENIFYFNPTESAVSQASSGETGPKRLTMNQVAASPSLLKDCRNTIYLRGEPMFDLNSYALNENIEGQLQKLEQIRKSYPDRSWVIVGHSDLSGDQFEGGVFHNIELSEKRAAAVAQWLATNTGFDAEKIEIQGAGSKFPILNVPGDIPVNRRVEIRLKC